MTLAYSVVPASVRHVRPLALTMRTASAMAMNAYGFSPREALRRAFMASFYRRTALVDGRPVAMWGAAGPLLSERTTVWLVMSDTLAGLPRAVLKEARSEMAGIAANYPEIAATFLPQDEASLRFARHLGFDAESPVPIGTGEGVQLEYRVH